MVGGGTGAFPSTSHPSSAEGSPGTITPLHVHLLYLGHENPSGGESQALAVRPSWDTPELRVLKECGWDTSVCHPWQINGFRESLLNVSMFNFKILIL